VYSSIPERSATPARASIRNLTQCPDFWIYPSGKTIHKDMSSILDI
jgi:hypothetical protein